MAPLKQLANRVIRQAMAVHATLRRAREAMTGDEVRAILGEAERQVDAIIASARAAGAADDAHGEAGDRA